MATLPTLSTTSIPKILSRNPESFETQKRDFVKKIPHSSALRIGVNYCKIRSTRLYAGLSEIEPDLNEDPVDRWRTNGIDSVCFLFCDFLRIHGLIFS